MKKLFILLTLALSTINCSQDFKSSDMIGTWNITGMDAHVGDIAPAILEGGKKEAYSTVYEFLENGKFKMTSNAYPEGADGSYELNLESHQLTMRFKGSQDPNEITETYQISDLSNNTMTWTLKLGEMGSITFNLDKK